MTLEKLVEMFGLTLDENNDIYIRIKSDSSITFCPLETLDGCIAITKEQFEKLISGQEIDFTT